MDDRHADCTEAGVGRGTGGGGMGVAMAGGKVPHTFRVSLSVSFPQPRRDCEGRVLRCTRSAKAVPFLGPAARICGSESMCLL